MTTSPPFVEGQALPPCQEWVTCFSASLLWHWGIRVCGWVIQHSVNPPFYVASMCLNFWNNVCGFLSASSSFSTSYMLVTLSPALALQFLHHILLLPPDKSLGEVCLSSFLCQMFSGNENDAAFLGRCYGESVSSPCSIPLECFLGSTLRVTLNLYPLSGLSSLSYISKLRYAFFFFFLYSPLL